jgi:Zn-dependent peptidase ImmA (M78 family)
MEAGLLPAPDEVVDALAQALDYPRRFFFQADPVYGASTSEFFHRKRQSAPVRVLDQLHARLNIQRIHIDRLLRSVDFTGRGRFERADIDDFGSAEEIARKVRADWRLPPGPVKDLVGTVERAGAMVVRFSFGTPLVDAISIWAPELPPIFFLNADMPPDRERLSLAHEIGHVVMHTSVRPDMEEEADRFAGEFLLPETDVRPQLHDLSLARLGSLKPYWRVSMAAILTRASRLSMITPSRAKSLWVQLSQRGYRKREPAELDFPREVPRAVAELVQVHLDRLGYTLAEVSELVAMTESEFGQYYGVRSVGGRREKLTLV